MSWAHTYDSVYCGCAYFCLLGISISVATLSAGDFEYQRTSLEWNYRVVATRPHDTDEDMQVDTNARLGTL